MAPITERIITFNRDRLPDLVKHKYDCMSENLYRFYRGTNHIFCEDLQAYTALPASPLAWICGDLHLENFGSYKSDNRLVYFDLNDFDEAVLGPVHWELTRVLTSIFIAFQSLGIEEKKAGNMAQLFLKTYSAKLANGKADYLEPRTAKGMVRKFLKAVSRRRQEDILSRKTIRRNNKLEILLDIPKHAKLKKELKDNLRRHLQDWLQHDGRSPYNYAVNDIVFRIAGTGSLGIKRYIILLKSRNDNGEKYLLLDMKQALPSSVSPFLQHIPQPAWASESERVVSTQRWMQNRSPALLSTTHFMGDDYVIQEMQPTEDSINFKLLKKNYRDMIQVIDDMAMLVASSQLRSSGRKGSATVDELIAFGENKDWQEPVMEYAVHYAREVAQYHRQFLQDRKNGVLSGKQEHHYK